MLKSKAIITAAAVGAMFAATPAFAQNAPAYGLEVGASTLGIYAAPTLNLGRNDIEARAPLYFLSRKAEFEDDGGNKIHGKLSVTSGAVVADYYLGSTGIRLSGGISLGGYEVEAKVNNPEIDGYKYHGSINVKVEQSRKVAPVLAIGYRYQSKNKWGFSTELGARLSSVELEAGGFDAFPESERKKLETDIREINDDLGNVKAIPFAAIGLSFKF